MTVDLDEELVRLACSYTDDLGSTLDGLLREYIRRQHSRHVTDQAMIDRQIEVWNAYHAEHGLLSDEFSTL